MDYVEARFWLGASVAQYQMISKHGDDVVGQLAVESGVSKAFLYESLRLFDTFGGDFDGMYRWAIAYMKGHGSLMATDVKRLVGANTERSNLAREVRRHNGRTGDTLALEDARPPKLKKAARRSTGRQQRLPFSPSTIMREALTSGHSEIRCEHGGRKLRVTVLVEDINE